MVLGPNLPVHRAHQPGAPVIVDAPLVSGLEMVTFPFVAVIGSAYCLVAEN
jgi:hypothetical protein